MFQLLFNILKKLCSPLFTAFRSALPILIVVLFILAQIAIWWAGPWLTIGQKHPLSPLLSRGLASALCTLVFFMWWGIAQWRKLHQFQSEQSHQLQLQSDPIRRYEERQEFELNRVMQGMQQSLNKRNYLYALPWYLVLGLENAGKTSLINRSGQKFVFSNVMRASGKKSENPYSFDWWIGDDSVLIDPDGELLTQRHNEVDNDGELERRLWLNFVQWLEKTRSRRPLNGVILTLDIAHLATASVSERRAYASLLRARLRELMEVLSTRMPVYITLTKLDLLYGFEPFFREYSKEQRDEVFGFTFTLDSVSQLDQWLSEFETEYSAFIDRINHGLPKALQGVSDEEDRTAIYSFARQMAGLLSVLKQFFEEALASDQFSTSALVRGVYLTSVYQQGVPVDAYVDASARRYGLNNVINSAQHADNSTTYFTSQLFKRIVYPEAGLASDNFRAVQQKRHLLTLSTITCVIASVLLVGGWQRYYAKNSHQAQQVLSRVELYNKRYAGISWQGQSEQEILPPLNMLRDAALEFGPYRKRTPIIADMGLYQGKSIGPKIEKSYLDALRSQYLPVLLHQVVADMMQAQNDERRLSLLRVYRMMTDQSGRHNRYVEDYFSKVWQREYPGQLQIQQMLMAHLDYTMAHINLNKLRNQGNRQVIAMLKPYDSTISAVQQQLSQVPVAQRVYRNLQQNAALVLGAPLDLRKQIGPMYNLVFNTDEQQSSVYAIPQLYTAHGFKDYFLAQLASVSNLALIDSWVLGERQHAQYSEADKEVLRQHIRDLYINDYTRYWRDALSHVDVKYFTNLNDAINVLNHVNGSMQPYNRLLETVRANTQLFPNLPKNDAARMELMKSNKYAIGAQIAEPFNQLNSLIATTDGKPVYMAEVMDAVGKLNEYLKSIQSAANVGQAALEATKARLGLQNSDPIYTVERIASNLPSPMNKLVKKLADESWQAVKQQAIGYLQTRWYKDVYQPYEQKIASRYPFNASSSHDVSLKDFTDFFAPNGVIDQFYNTQLKLFLDEGQTDGSNTHQVMLRKAIAKEMAHAEQIQHAFFNRKGALDVEFSLQPVDLSANKMRSIINIDGQYVEYDHGAPQQVDLMWPNSLRSTAISKLTLVPTMSNASPRSIIITGPWAFFRLLDHGQIVGESSTQVKYQFNIDGGHVIYQLSSEVDGNPFTDALFKSFHLSKNLY
ncbi:type VI secretion system membrane subunit TssM [Celerinatantimonas yamalensis]|uniref:Type VI secretion system membrane subunit TssM n=1 Tax=Celerinatantimonas yamalensis TaxID=559956 RepID=A0ABW9G462_9GAMM